MDGLKTQPAVDCLPSLDRNRLRDARVGASLTQEGLAASIGVSTSTLRRWERGTCEPGATELACVAVTCGVTMESLIGNLSAAPTMQAVLLSPEDCAFVRDYQHASPALRRIIRDSLRDNMRLALVAATITTPVRPKAVAGDRIRALHGVKIHRIK